MKSENEKAAHQLQDVRQWAKDKIADGQEPPWSWYQHMKLIDAIDAILGGAECTITTENLQQSESRLDGHLRLVDSTYSQGNAPHHLSDVPVQMPM